MDTRFTRSRNAACGYTEEVTERIRVAAAADIHASEPLRERLERAFSQILDELGHQYLVAYSPTNMRRDGTWRKIAVTVDGGHTVRARQGYRDAEGRGR